MLAASLIVWGIAVFLFPKPCGNLSRVAGSIDTICECIGVQYSDIKENGTDIYCMGLCLQDKCSNTTSRGILREKYSIALTGFMCSNSTEDNFKLSIMNDGIYDIVDTVIFINVYKEDRLLAHGEKKINLLKTNQLVELNFTLAIPEEYKKVGEVLNLEIGLKEDNLDRILFKNINCITVG